MADEPVLKPFQHEGAAFLAARTRALLADEPGVGKTGQLIEACNRVDAKRVCVVCPSIGIEHWRREVAKWSGGRQLDLQLIDWGNAQALAAHLSKGFQPQWDVLIADECHWGKNPQAKRSKAVFGTGGLGWYAKRIWAASGTPSPNNAAELWPLLRAFGKTKLDLDTFTRYFCKVDMAGKVRGNREDHIEELRAILKSFSLRRLKKDVLPELGEIDVQDWYVKPSAEFAMRMIGLEDANKASVLGLDLGILLPGQSDDDILAMLSDPARDFATLRRYNALLKAPAVFETVKFELENGLLDKVVIYGYHKDALTALEQAFDDVGIGSCLIYGGTPMHMRDSLIETWKKSPTVPVMLASIAVAGTALDFTAAHQGIMLELTWVPGDNWQAMQRMHRHGQENPVTVRVATGTPIDEIVNGVLLRKMKMISEIYS